jgi:hypothetical protein
MGVPRIRQLAMAQHDGRARHAQGARATTRGSRAGHAKRNLGAGGSGFGFSSYHLLHEGESIEQFERFHKSLVRDLAPEGAMEHMLVDRIAGNFWRLRRVAMLDRKLMEENVGKTRELLCKVAGNIVENAMENLSLDPVVKDDERMLLRMTKCYLEGCFPHQEGWDTLMRYEAHLRKGIYDALGELRRLQKARGSGRRVDSG